MLGLITDRTQRNVYYRSSLSNKGFSGMTTEEKAEWLGDPLVESGVNLFSYGPFYSSTVDVKYRSEEIVASTSAEGIYLYAISIIGEAAKYANKVFTLSAESITSSTTGTPQLALYWHDDFGFEYAGASLSAAGSVTFDMTEWPNTNNRQYLAMYIYVTTHETVSAGASAHFGKVMLENGSERHEYVPYTEILATTATKGAYNYSDLNRVERAVSEISDLAGLNLVTKVDWNMWDIPTASEMERYINNVSAIYDIIPDKTDIPLPPLTMNNITYLEANNIEIILNAAHDALTKEGEQ